MAGALQTAPPTALLEPLEFVQLPPMAPLDPYQEQRLRRRLAALELSRSTSRALILDSDAEPVDIGGGTDVWGIPIAPEDL